MATPDLQRAFETWANRALAREIPDGTIAFHFNLYEGKDAFHVQLVGAARFSRDDPSWPCAETFTTGEDVFELPHSVVGLEWERCLEATKAAVQSYIARSAGATALRGSRAVGVGFVDGDVEVVWEAGAA